MGLSEVTRWRRSRASSLPYLWVPDSALVTSARNMDSTAEMKLLADGFEAPKDFWCINLPYCMYECPAFHTWLIYPAIFGLRQMFLEELWFHKAFPYIHVDTWRKGPIRGMLTFILENCMQRWGKSQESWNTALVTKSCQESMPSRAEAKLSIPSMAPLPNIDLFEPSSWRVRHRSQQYNMASLWSCAIYFAGCLGGSRGRG